jgi:bisphosphoglycerate-independent phosphoglycerate mutase (AlkP superfamily)
MNRHEDDLGAGRAVSSEIVNDGWIKHLGHHALPDVTAEKAGGNLAAIAADAELTLYAHYATDTAGHRGGMEGSVAALERVDRFLAGVLGGMPSDMTLLIASDHGNIEDVTGGHTQNPALGLAAGPGSDDFAHSRSLLDVAPAVLRHLHIAA